MKITIKAGPPVEGNNFYGREKELAYAWENYILNDSSILLSAPRRVGKSSFSKRLLKMAEENEWRTLYLDISGIRTENEFIKSFKDEFKSTKWWNKIGEIFLKLLDSVKPEKGSICSDVWRNDTYGKIMQLLENMDKTLIVIDELGVFLNHLLEQENGKEKVESFLEWLRKFRQTKKVQWIFCSSVGIENFASMHQLSKHLNDLKSVFIGEFSEGEARSFISLLDVDEKVQFTENDIQYILSKLVWCLPFFIQLLVEKINYMICVEDYKLSDKTIDEAYNRLINEDHFNSWDERLKEYYEFEDISRKILIRCAEISKGRSREDLLTSLLVKKSNVEKTEDVLSQSLYMLQNDGYLVENNGNYIFRSPLLRDFWLKKFKR